MGNKELKKVNWVAIACGFILVLQAAASFPSIRVEGRTIRLFAFEGMFRGDLYHARVLGNHVLETEHGQIRLGQGSSISVSQNTFVGIDVENFVDGRASHNLIVCGIEMPKNIRVSFSFNPIELSLLRLDGQEVTFSGISMVVRDFDLTPSRSTADVSMEFSASGQLTLTGGTEIYFSPRREGGRMLRLLEIYRNDKLWRIVGRTAVRVLGETEFTEFRSITFRPDWGEFITGELFE